MYLYRFQDLYIVATALVIKNFCFELTEIQLCLAFLWTDSFLFNYSTFSMTAAAFTIESKITRKAIYFFCTPKILKSYIIPGWNCFWNHTCLHTIFSLCNHYILLWHYLSIPRSLCGIVKLLISNIVHFEKMEEAARFLFFVLKWIIANPKSNWQKSFSSQLHYLEKSGGQNAQQNGINICWLNFRK